ncbi:hypothetical protein SLE2022_218240 [Rubroshorea leprosula]
MRRKESLFSSASVLFPLFLFLSFVTVQGRSDPISCSSSCGNLTNIRYPFRLEGDPPGCGDPEYQFSCADGETILNFHSGRYLVRRIIYEERIIRVVDVNLARGSCNLPNRSLSMEEVIGDGRYSGVLTYNHINFLRCPENLTDPAYTRVPCLSGNANHVFANISDHVLYPHQLPESCVKTSVVPTIYNATEKNLSYEAISRMQEEGFDLGWSVDCRDCMADGGYCQLRSQDIKPYTYKCSHGDYMPRWKIILIWVGVILIGVIGLIVVLAVIGLILCKCKRRRKKNENMEDIAQGHQQNTAV